MYKLAEDTEAIRELHKTCSTYMKELEHLLKEEYGISSQVSLVGSAKRNLITLNGNDRSIDFDYNLKVYNGMDSKAADLKNNVRSAFNEIMRRNGHKDVNDSTSSLTTKPIFSWNAAPYQNYHIDLCIITEHKGQILRLIHDKGNNRYIWNTSSNISALKNKERVLKPSHWLEVRKVYVDKKNLHINDKENHPSYNCYIEAVNEVYYKYFHK